jgi:hypothetical protein
MRFSPRPLVPAIAAIAAVTSVSAATVLGCGPSQDAKSARTPLAEKWYARAKQAFQTGDFEDARDAGQSALQASSSDPEIRLLNARIALSRLDYAQAIKLTEGTQTADGHGVRGRAYWYNGDIEQAADELEAMLQDPNVKDPWAREIAKLARRGAGRHPFAMEGGLVAAVEMPRAGPALIVPCELEGEQVLAMVATATGEVVVDSNSRKEAAWVNLRFGSVEVKDVPALTQDLSAVSRQLGAPIKALLGVNLLRHMHVTFDRRGDQFVVRKDEPSAPPESTRVPLWYVRGGGMLLRASVTAKKDEPSVFLVDSSAMFPLALEDATWKKAGVDVAKLQPEPSLPGMKSGVLPVLTLGGFDLPQVPAVQGAPAFDMKSSVDVDLGGIAGAGLLSLFRVTFGDEGRFIWLEADPMLTQQQRGGGRSPEPSGSPPPGNAESAPPPPAPSAPPKPPLKPDATPAKPAAPTKAPAPAPSPNPAAKK